MHIQIVTFQLADIDADAYRALAVDIAAAWALVPGLKAKYWLDNEAENSFGGIYHWESREHMESYLASELYQSLLRNPQLRSAASRDFALIERATEITYGFGPALIMG
jgi:quinol monooxygenase YgiN